MRFLPTAEMRFKIVSSESLAAYPADLSNPCWSSNGAATPLINGAGPRDGRNVMITYRPVEGARLHDVSPHAINLREA